MTTVAAPAQEAGFAPPARSRRKGGGRLAVIDLLRLCAALMVVLFHYGATAGEGSRYIWGMPAAKAFPQLFPVASYGWLGVELFFLISGFVICMSGWGRGLTDFVVSRVVRLFPAYWVGVALTSTVLFLWPTVIKHRPLKDTLINFSMLQTPLGSSRVDVVYWTLWAEMRFYLIFAVLVWAGVTYRRVLLLCWVWIFAVAVATASDEALLKTVLMPYYAPYFIAGMAFYLIHRFGQTSALWGTAGASLLMALYFLDKVESFNGKHHQPIWPAMVAIVAFFALMAVISLGWLSWINWRWLTAAGALTYPLYLIHCYSGWTLIFALHGRVSRSVLLGGVVLTMLLGAWVINRVVERPAMPALKRALRNSFERMRTASNPEPVAGGPGSAGRQG